MTAQENAIDRARAHAARVPLAEIDVSHVDLHGSDTHWPYFARLRREAPVHFCRESHHGSYWSLTRFQDIKRVDADHASFSSDTNITLFDQEDEFTLPMFIAMDPPTHDVQRKAVTPVVAPRNLAALEGTIRARAAAILDDVPVGEPFDWVERVAIELTTQMLATLLDFPFEERRRLTHWSDVMTGGTISGAVRSREERRSELLGCLERFTELWWQKADEEPGNDLISMLVHGESTHDMIERPLEYLGNVMLLIVGGNDTTRNSIAGGVLALNRYPGELDKVKRNPALVPNMVSEIVRWQTPLAHMRRTALADVEIGGERIRRGDKVVMWYVSGNRDEDVFDDADALRVDRANARQHVSFGYGIHRCMGNRLAEMQLRVLWEEILARFDRVEVVGDAERVRSNLVRGYRHLPVVVHPR